MRIIKSLFSGFFMLLAVLHLFHPDFLIDIISLTLILIAILPWIIQIIKTIELPGGTRIELKELRNAEKKANEVGLISEVNSSDSQYSFQMISDEDSQLALAGLRIEIEKRLKEIATNHNLQVNRKGVGQLLRMLSKENILSRNQENVLSDLVGLLNKAVHANYIDDNVSQWALEVGPRLLKALDREINFNE